MALKTEGQPPKNSRDTLILSSHDNSETSHFPNHRTYGPQTEQDTGYSMVITVEEMPDPGISLFLSFFVSKSIYQMLKNPSRCNGNLVLTKNKLKNAN